MKELYQSACNMLTERYVWEARQRIYYQMRHYGLPRLNKPFPTAADAHFPEIDMAIRRLKPFWIGQVTAGDRLCSFTSMKQQLETMDDAAADYFNFELIQRTDFMRKLREAIDYMLLRGRGVIKSHVDPMDGYKLTFEAVDPYFIIMPQAANNFDDADEFIHCRNMTIPAYKRLPTSQYNQEQDTIKRIRGGQDFQSLGLENIEVRLREGISFTTQENRTVLFEHYTKTGSGWQVDTYCPQAPDVQLRKPYQVTTKYAGKVSQPFYSFQMEVKDPGWYSPRGLGDLLAPVEQYMTKLWNAKADFITFSNTPMFTGEKELLNGANIRFQPGEYVPGNVKSLTQTAPPIDFDREIMFARGIGEEQSQSPDFGITKANGTGNGTSDPRTAREISAIGALQSAGTTDNANMFREDLTKLYKHVWGLIIQFKNRDFTYYAKQTTQKLDEQVLHDQYLIQPDGSPENWNRMARFQKAVGLLQITAGNPLVDPEPIVKEMLTAYDANMAQKAFIPSNLKGANEYEDQVVIINTMLCPGGGKPAFPAPVKPNQDHATRIHADLDWIKAATIKGTPVDPQSRQLLIQDIAQHLDILKKQNPDAAKEIEPLIIQIEQAGAQQSTGGQPPVPGAASPDAQAVPPTQPPIQ